MSKFILLIILSFSLLSCSEQNKNNRINNKNALTSYNGFPDSATNLSIVNSEYDDYNSAQQGDGGQGTFIFSSNRNSKGKDFDIVQYNTMSWYIYFDDNLTVIDVDTNYHHTTSTVKSMLTKINTAKNEFGPYIYEIPNTSECLLLYAQEDSGKLDLKFMTFMEDSVRGNMHYLNTYGPYDVELLNTLKSNEAYISIDNRTMYYCSDKAGNFDVYQYAVDSSVYWANDYLNFLTKKATAKPLALKAINSPFDDKCPYVTNDFMVFTSNRPGGLGGYDLWYSRLVNGKWAEPKNFGPAINSPYDEYRPIVKPHASIPNTLMIFSSNRPGGKGGFDLYYVGIEKLKEEPYVPVAGVMPDSTQQ